MPQSNAPCLLDAKQMETHLQRLCREITATFGSDPTIALLGIRTRGLYLAERLKAMLEEILQREVPLGVLDITLYRDDLSELAGSPIVRPTEIPFSLRERSVILVDDVLFTGRTIRAAMDALLDHGRPRRVWLAVLVDRGGRELPIQGDFVGLKLDVAMTQRVSVHMKDVDGEDAVLLESRS
ncbi:MAG TPA: bifunctional pyr operon transcriptional regulator/uracil phosphoribosyltransferase PyrR [Holophaga sp.]|nr:bifunctional pyr operon transcriptional regulator/uracil phosphoribosyltransferase PyrR [Holophaga sp.]